MTTSPIDTPDTVEPLGEARLETPIGELTVVASRAGVRAVLWPVDGESERTGVSGAVDLASSATTAVLDQAVKELREYFAGSRTTFDVALDPVGTAFQQTAWRALTTIGFGETISYAEQAERLGDRGKARAVGAANGKNPISIIVPCHRVVASDGALTGFAGGLDTKRWLLDHEARVAGTRLC